MNCKKAYALIQDFVDGGLTGPEAKAFGRHVAGCSKCTRELERYGSLVSSLGEVTLEEVPAGFGERVISHLKQTGRIHGPVPSVQPRRAWPAVFDWVPTAFRAPAFAAVLVLALLSVVSIVSGQFTGFVGKSTVIAADAFIDVQDTITKVNLLDRVLESVSRDVRTVKTVLDAVLSLAATAGEAFMLPAMAFILMLVVGLGWYLRTANKRSTQNASFSF